MTFLILQATFWANEPVEKMRNAKRNPMHQMKNLLYW